MTNLKLPAITDYRAGLDFLKGRESAPLAYATRIRQFAGRVIISHHGTDIVTHYNDGRIRLNNGGYHTRTTAHRMHALTPDSVRVNIRQGVMHVECVGEVTPLDGHLTLEP